MPIEFRCTNCQQMLRTPDDSAGQEARCPQCGALTPVPAPAPMPPQDMPPQGMRPGAGAAAAPGPLLASSDNPYAASQMPGGEYVRHTMAETLPSGLAVSSLVVGIIGMLLSLVCGCFIVFSVPLDLIAVVLGVIALQKCKRGEAEGRGMAIAGIICGSIGLLLSLLVLLFLGVASMMGKFDLPNPN